MSIRTTSRRRLVAGSLIAATLTVGGTGVATAATPGTPAASLLNAFGMQIGQVDAGAADDAAANDVAPGPDDAAYDAFFGAGFTYYDAAALADLWKVDVQEAKARAGHMVIDGETLPVAPGSTVPTPEPGDPACAAIPEADAEYTDAQYEAFWGAGYTIEDVDALSALWNTGCVTTKAQAGQLLLDGKPVPVVPGSTPVAG